MEVHSYTEDIKWILVILSISSMTKFANGLIDCTELIQFSSVVSDSFWPMDCSMPGFPCPSPAPGACSNSCPLSQWRHPTFPPVIPFSTCLQSFPASGSFPMSQLFPSGGQRVTSGQTANGEWEQTHPSADDWIKDLLSMALPAKSVSHSVVFDSLWPPRTVGHQASLSMGFSRQEYWSG